MPPVPNALGLRGQVPWWTRLQAALIRQLNRFFAPPQFVLHPEEAARKSQADLQAEEFGRSRQGFLRLRESLSLRGRVALDLACGGGVKTASLAAAFPEPRLVVGIDVDAAALRRGRSFSCQHGGTIYFRAPLNPPGTPPSKGVQAGPPLGQDSVGIRRRLESWKKPVVGYNERRANG